MTKIIIIYIKDQDISTMHNMQHDVQGKKSCCKQQYIRLLLLSKFIRKWVFKKYIYIFKKFIYI